jgi:hypothetical protein
MTQRVGSNRIETLVINRINSSYDTANAAFNAANTSVAGDTYARNTANASFIRANNSINANTGGTITGNVTVVGNVSSNIVTFFSEYDNGNSDASITINFGRSQKQKLTLTANTTLTFNAPPGVGNFLLKLVQDGTGGRLVTWPASVKWTLNTSPTLSSNANSVDIATFYYDGTNYYGVASLNFA